MITVHPIRVKNQGSFINYTYILVDNFTRNSIIIDPGWEYNTILRQLDLTQSRLRGILLTHHHTDHSMLATAFAEAFNVPVFISSAEKDHYNFRCFNLHSFSSDQPFSIGSFDVFPYLTPGHTKGSVCFQIDHYLFTGDTLFVEGCGICNNEESALEMFHSIQKLMNNIKQLTKIYPGHSYGILPGVTFNYLISQNIYCHLKKESDFISFRLRKNQKGLFNFK